MTLLVVPTFSSTSSNILISLGMIKMTVSDTSGCANRFLHLLKWFRHISRRGAKFLLSRELSACPRVTAMSVNRADLRTDCRDWRRCFIYRRRSLLRLLLLRPNLQIYLFPLLLSSLARSSVGLNYCRHRQASCLARSKGRKCLVS